VLTHCWSLLGTRQQLDKITVQTLSLPKATVSFSAVVNNLGVLLDSQLSMADHIAALSRSCFFYMRQLRSIKQSLTPDAMRTLIHAFVSSRLDYCNSILAGVSSQLLQKLQVIQNAAACLITGARRCDHMTPVMRDLYWLPIRQRITFKTAVLAYKCQHSMAPQYLQTYCQPMSARSGRRHLRSFAVQGPRVWNSLPAELRDPDIAMDTFWNRLKTFLFDMQL